jgi:hypothetical protein
VSIHETILQQIADEFYGGLGHDEAIALRRSFRAQRDAHLDRERSYVLEPVLHPACAAAVAWRYRRCPPRACFPPVDEGVV